MFGSDHFPKNLNLYGKKFTTPWINGSNVLLGINGMEEMILAQIKLISGCLVSFKE
jgi:hypothetical protein